MVESPGIPGRFSAGSIIGGAEMSIGNTLAGVALAAAAALAFSAAPIVASAGSTGHCHGVNACKGKSSCKTADH